MLKHLLTKIFSKHINLAAHVERRGDNCIFKDHHDKVLIEASIWEISKSTLKKGLLYCWPDPNKSGIENAVQILLSEEAEKEISSNGVKIYSINY